MDKELGKLSSDVYFTAQLPAGKHAFEVQSEAKDVLTIGAAGRLAVRAPMTYRQAPRFAMTIASLELPETLP